MTIVKLQKATIYGLARQRDEVLDQLQRLGCLHLIDLPSESAGGAPEHPHRSAVHAALKYLHACPVQNSNQHTDYDHGGGCRQIADQVLQVQRDRQQLDDQHDDLLRRVKTLEPWGEFQLPASDAIAGLGLWFYRLRHRQLAELQQLDVPWTQVNQDHQFAYVVVVSGDEPSGMLGNRIDLDLQPLSQLRSRLAEIDEQREALHWQRVALTRWTALLSRDLDEADDEVARMAARYGLIEDGHTFALQGWVPCRAAAAVREFASRQGLALVIQPPDAEDKPPTLLSNPRAVAGAEGAVTFYITPDYRSWDPTGILYVSFAVFFAMIVSDAGYGLVFGGLILVFWHRLSATEAGRRLRIFLVWIVGLTIAYGVLVGSYFGASPPDGSWLDRGVWKIGGRSIMHDDNRSAMMLLAVAVGVLHLVLANLIAAWQNRESARWLSGAGWAAALLGGLAMGVSQLIEPPLVPWLAARLGAVESVLRGVFWQGGVGALAAGLGAVLLFSSDRPLWSPRIRDWVWRLLDGLQATTNVSKAFGDSLSYLRLFALGLASTKLAATFNELAGDVRGVPGVGLLLAILIVLAGHSLNVVLGIVAGVVHGLRLNCIEFFSWCLTDEGYPFRAFSKKAGT